VTHITEGAIPFAARNPIVVIPILMVASSISAVLTYLFGVGVPAPHGGFLVLPVVINPLLWVAAILTGSFVGGFAYGFWKNRTADNTEVENIIDDNIDAMGPTSITTS